MDYRLLNDIYTSTSSIAIIVQVNFILILLENKLFNNFRKWFMEV